MSKNKKKPHENVREGIKQLEQRTSDTVPGRGIIESARKGRLAKAQQNFAKTEVPISAIELARLAMIRTNPSTPLSEIENSTLDEIIELTARCQWRLELNRGSWGAYGAAFFEEAKDEPDIPESIQKIYSLKGPIDFDEGLKLMGVPGRGTKTKPVAEVRKEKFFPFFRQWAIEDSQFAHFYRWDESASPNREDWKAPTDEEIEEKYQKQIQTGWADPSSLGLMAERYAKWRECERSKTNRMNARRKRK